MIRSFTGHERGQFGLQRCARLRSLFEAIALLTWERKDVYYVFEGKLWSVRHDGASITSNLPRLRGCIVTRPWPFIQRSVFHFGSINTFCRLDGFRLPHPSNHTIVTWFHVSPGDTRTRFIEGMVRFVDLWHTSCQVTRRILCSLGVPEEKLVVIPLGVNLGRFKPPERETRESGRARLGIRPGQVVLGSFQKDGNGWGEGLEPKRIKGPDVFCDVVEYLKKRFDVFVLLTGPARGYVRQRLESAGVPHHHVVLEDPEATSDYYGLLDIYLVASRVEGGPKAILESMACGIPLVSTRVGMAPDVIQDGQNGILVDIEDTAALVAAVQRIINDKGFARVLALAGMETASNYDWTRIAAQYEEKLYRRVLGSRALPRT